MYTKISKEYKFDCAHRLANHEGLCKNVHGHTYKMQVELTGNLVSEKGHPAEGMLIDFSKLKKIVHELIVDRIDHSYVVNTKSDDSIDSNIHSMFVDLGLKIFAMDSRPTAENMARTFARLIKYSTLTKNQDNIRSIKVTVWETPTSCASYKIPAYDLLDD